MPGGSWWCRPTALQPCGVGESRRKHPPQPTRPPSQLFRHALGSLLALVAWRDWPGTEQSTACLPACPISRPPTFLIRAALTSPRLAPCGKNDPGRRGDCAAFLLLPWQDKIPAGVAGCRRVGRRQFGSCLLCCWDHGPEPWAVRQQIRACLLGSRHKDKINAVGEIEVAPLELSASPRLSVFVHHASPPW